MPPLGGLLAIVACAIGEMERMGPLGARRACVVRGIAGQRTTLEVGGKLVDVLI